MAQALRHKRPKTQNLPVMALSVRFVDSIYENGVLVFSLGVNANGQVVVLETPFKKGSVWKEEIIFLPTRQKCFFKKTIHAVQRKQFLFFHQLLNSKPTAG